MITQAPGQTPPGPGGGGLGRWRERLAMLARPGQLSRSGKLAYWSAAVAVLVAAAFVLTVAAAPGGKVSPPPPPAKNFTLPELGHPGTTVSLTAFAGRPVIVNFFASWCGPCRRETPLLARYYASQRGRVAVIGVDANDETAAALTFAAKAGVRYLVGFDAFPSPVTTSYGVYALPQTFFLDARHHIVAKVMGALTERVLVRDVALMNRERG